ncbi:hypothetical protein [Gorillibacterium timonense]|uniref:hypothetical protein n=1 Tax=Gorillibacterium timonense TaxID=1689269 RepID=UPI00071D100D|nr:hypothetical protein [Gorillibacterium timonense]
MGLDAYVQCNCLKEGKVKPPPFDLGLIEWIDGEFDLAEAADDDVYHHYCTWKETACEHEDFHFVYDRVYNASGGMFFYGVLEQLGKEEFPVLSSVIGNGNTSPDMSHKAMVELEILENRIVELEGVFLMDTDAQEEYRKILVGEDYWFYSHGREYYYRMSERGFVVTDSEQKELFRSLSFSQEVMQERLADHAVDGVRFRDLESGKVHESGYPISSFSWESKAYYYPRAFHVAKRHLTRSDLYQTKVLKRLFEASIVTGNPIVWS